MLREKFTVLRLIIEIKECQKSQAPNFRRLEKEEQIKSKVSKRKGIKNRDLKLKLWETNKGCSINEGCKINKTDEP